MIYKKILINLNKNVHVTGVLDIDRNVFIETREGGIISFNNKYNHLGSNTTIKAIGNGCIQFDGVGINTNCYIVSMKSISIGAGSILGPNVVCVDHDHDFKNQLGLSAMHYTTGTISIGKNVWIGANTVILKDTIIGDNCVIGAGSVVKGEIPKGTILIQKREKQVMSY